MLNFSLLFPEHVKPLIEQIEKLGEALYNIQFEQHWLEAQTDRQAIGKHWTLIWLDKFFNFKSLDSVQ